MRLQLILLGVAFGGSEAATRLDVYDDGQVQVVMPAVSATWDGKKTGVTGAYTVNAVSGATNVLTTDAVSSATTFSEVRHQMDVRIDAHPKPTWTAGASGLASLEPDYRTWAGGVDGAVDLFKRMSTLTGNLAVSLERLGRIDDPAFFERSHAEELEVAWVQILRKTTKGTVRLNGATRRCPDTHGCLASPYRFIALETAGNVLSVAERNPHHLERGAASVALSQAVGKKTALHGWYRYYADTWQVRGHTITGELARTLLDDRLLVRGGVRWADQDATAFYRDRYQLDPTQLAIPTFRTADRELSGLNSTTLTGRGEWSFYNVGPAVRLGTNLRVARGWHHYPAYSEWPERRSWLVGGGAHAEF